MPKLKRFYEPYGSSMNRDTHRVIDRGTLEYMLVRAKFKQLKVYDPVNTTFYGQGWGHDVMPFWKGPDEDFIGETFAPIKHNYLYGFKQRPVIEDLYKKLVDSPGAPKLMQEAIDEVRKVMKTNVPTMTDYLRYVLGPPERNYLFLIVGAFSPDMKLGDRIFLLNSWWVIQAKQMSNFNVATQWALPPILLAQLVGLGWRKMLVMWVLGILVTEGASATIDFNLSGWSVIQFMCYGQFMEEIFEDRKLRTVKGGLQTARGLGINALGGYGVYLTVSNMIKDPTPFFMGKSAQTGVHHGLHHLGIIMGALINRWSG